MINERIVENTKEILKSHESNICKKKMDKIFSDVNTNASLKEALSTFTRADLDDVRKKLGVIGASSLKKSELIDVLEENIKSSLPSTIEKLSKLEYDLLVKIVQNDGLLKFEKDYIDEVLSLRKYGILVTAQIKDYGRYLLIPQELRPELEILNNNSDSDVACTLDSYESNITPSDTLVEKTTTFNFGKIGRNEICPCGSGIKFKRCCITSKIPTITR